MIYLVYGPDEYSRDEFIKSHVAKTGFPRTDFGSEHPPALDDLLAQDLFSGASTFVVFDVAEELLQENAIDQLAASANHILFVQKELDLRTKFAKWILSESRVQKQEFLLPATERLPQWVVDKAKQLGSTCSLVAARVLCQRLGYIDPLGGLALSLRQPSLVRLEQELQKLGTYAGNDPITEEIVVLLVPDDRQSVALSIADGLAKKNRPEVYALLSGYYSESGGEDETTKTLGLTALLAEQFRSQLQVKSAQQQGVKDADLLTQTGWKSGRLYVLKRLAASFSQAQLQSLLAKLETLDVELKTTTTPPRVVLELILAQIM